MQDSVVDTVAGTCALRLRRQGWGGGFGCVWLLIAFPNGRTKALPSWVAVDLMSLVINDKLPMRLERRRMVSHAFPGSTAVGCRLSVWLTETWDYSSERMMFDRQTVAST